MKLVILAAGMGSRFGGLKQIEPMDDFGNFIVDYSIYDAIEAGFDSVVFIIKEEMYHDFKETIGKRIENKIKTEYVFQKTNDLPEGFKCPEDRKKPWGTAHAIMAARDVVDEHFMIINADDYYGKDAFKVAANYIRSLGKEDEGKFANVVYNVKNTMTENGSVKRGVCFQDENGYLTKMIESSIEKDGDNNIIATPLENGEKFQVNEDASVSMNMFIFTKDMMKYLVEKFPAFLNKNKDNILSCEYLIPSVASELINEGKATVKLLKTDSIWYGVTYQADKKSVVDAFAQMVNEGKYKKGLW